jgi:hypothetical protein
MMSSATSTDRPGIRPWQFFTLAALIAATAGVLLAADPTPERLVLTSLAIGSAALAGLGLFHTLRPLVVPEAERDHATLAPRTRALLEREKTLTLRAIKELEFDRAMGKVSDADFRDMAGRLRARAGGLIRQLDESEAGYRPIIERELEGRLRGAAARRAERDDRPGAPRPGPTPAVPPAVSASRTCPSCETVNDSDARFCKGCGARLDE